MKYLLIFALFFSCHSRKISTEDLRKVQVTGSDDVKIYPGEVDLIRALQQLDSIHQLEIKQKDKIIDSLIYHYEGKHS